MGAGAKFFSVLVVALIIGAGFYYLPQYLPKSGGSNLTASATPETMTSTSTDTGAQQNVLGSTVARLKIKPHVIVKTNKGDIEIELATTTPMATENFLNLASVGFYNGTKFHRVINNFMIQGGDPNSKDDSKKDTWGTGGPGYAFPDEHVDEKLVRGVVAMANSGPDTNGSQFFIVTGEAPGFQGYYTPFGKIVKGLDVALAIQKVKTETNDRPVSPVIIESVTIVPISPDELKAVSGTTTAQ